MTLAVSIPLWASIVAALALAVAWIAAAYERRRGPVPHGTLMGVAGSTTRRCMVWAPPWWDVRAHLWRHTFGRWRRPRLAWGAVTLTRVERGRVVVDQLTTVEYRDDEALRGDAPHWRRRPVERR